MTFNHTATYSPEDNKLRIYPAHRLSAEEYAAVKAAGFAWAPKQEIFVAPMWTPSREDIALQFCGEIGDEDTTLCERAEDRAERFDGYRENRTADAEQARAAVARIADGLPLGQPILIGHHSERHARKDAERIENGMRRAVNMWETADYWKRRAAGALHAAQYKERPDVRARRIKGIEADARKIERTNAEAAEQLRLWSIVAQACAEGKPNAHDMALRVANVGGYASQCFPLADYPRDPPASQYEGQMGLYSALDGGVITAAQAAEIGQRWARGGSEHRARWSAHYAHRIAYERAMLAEGGGLAADAFDLQPGGIIQSTRGRRQVILKVNRRDGVVLSVTVAGQSWTVGVEEITSYEPPTEAAAASVAAATKVKPLCNYDGGTSFARMTEAEYKATYDDARMIRPINATATHEAHRLRHISGHLSVKHGGPPAMGYDLVPVFLTDAKIKPAPTIGGDPDKPKRKTTASKIAEAAGVDTSNEPDTTTEEATTRAAAAAVLADLTAPSPIECAVQIERMQTQRASREERKAEAEPFEAMREALRTGQAVQVVSAPQLFPTPAHVAQRMADLADIKPGDHILEPSAGTGMLVGACGCRWVGQRGLSVGKLHAVEINSRLADRLRSDFPLSTIHARDFLELDPDTFQPFDVVLMNPPFINASDVRHILHARRFLAPGGRLVAICAAGPRQHEALQPLADSWEYLPPGTFSGTDVRTVLLTMHGG
jgi:phospholipid N-methyltransferase